MSEFTPNRRTVIRTAAWSAPVVAVAAAAPAFAASPDPTLPNLSTSIPSATPPARSGNVVTLQPTVFVNTGGSTPTGLEVVFNTSEPLNIPILFNGVIDPSALGVVFGGTPNARTMSIPASLSTFTNDQFASSFTQALQFATSNPSTLQVTVTAGNGGVPYVSAEITV